MTTLNKDIIAEEGLAVQFTLQKIIKQYNFVSVEVTEEDWNNNPDGTMKLNAKKLAAKAIELGKELKEGWELESEEIIMNPIQRPKPDQKTSH